MIVFGTYDPTKADESRARAQAEMDRIFAMLPGTGDELAKRAGLSRYEIGTPLIALKASGRIRMDSAHVWRVMGK